MKNHNHTNGDLRTIETVCKELDALALTYLVKLEEYTQNWQITTSQLQQGFLQLAHAKYTMGSGKISQCSYDERMKAQARVTFDTATGKVVPLDPSPEEPAAATVKKKPSLRLRRRRSLPATEWAQDENLNDAADRNEYEMNEKKPGLKKVQPFKTTGRRDPLHWFGLLVSPSLRVSQEHFKTATMRIIDQANSIRELTALEERYRKLEHEKKRLMEEPVIKDDDD
ncbi:hypothetical protein BJV82DRAFT_675726 [Fennellomyces sp. T-0311]|nr:hypothetical protein BJV82DRAFT_675726 [Fennellomyces sp. T-0311]